MAKTSFSRLMALFLPVISDPLFAVALLALTVAERKTYRGTAWHLSEEAGAQKITNHITKGHLND